MIRDCWCEIEEILPGGSICFFRRTVGFAQQPSQKHFLARTIAFDQMAEELQNVSADEHRDRQQPLLETQ